MTKSYSWDFTPSNLEPQLGRDSVGFWEGAATGFQEGLNSTIPGLAIRHLKTLPGAKIGEEEFNQSAYSSAGIKWNNRMTWAEAQAAYDARSDKEVYEDVSRRMTTGGKVGEVVGNFGGAVLDPVNLLPIGTLNVASGFVRNVAKVGAVNAALEATLYQPAEAFVAGKEQTQYTASQYAMNVALAAGIGGLFGGAGYGISRFFENRALRLGELGESTPETADPTLLQSIAVDSPATPLGAPTSAVQGQGAPAASAATPTAPQASVGVRFPDENHKRFYNLDLNNEADRAFLEGNGFNAEDHAAYRSAVQRRIDMQLGTLADGKNVETEIAAPMLSSINFNHTRSTFRNPDLAERVQDRFNEYEIKTVTKKDQPHTFRENILKEELEHRARQLAALDDPNRPVPTKVPEEGVLVQRTSTGNEGKVGEVSVDEWYRRLFNPKFDEGLTRTATQTKLIDTKKRDGTQDSRLGLRQQAVYTITERKPDWDARLADKLKRLTPEQLDYVLYQHMNESDLAALAKHLGGTTTDRTANARFVQEQIQPRGGEAPPARAVSAKRVVEAVNAERVAELHKRLDEESKLINTDATRARDAITGVEAVTSPQDAVKFVQERFDLSKIRGATPEADRAVRKLEELQKRQPAILETMACLLGAKR